MKRSIGWSFVATVGCAALAFGCQPKGAGAELQTPQQAAKGCGPEGMIDDMEDNNNQVLLQGMRSGYWYTFLDESGSTVTPTAGAKGGTFTPSEGGAKGSAYAARFHGTIGTGAIVYAGMGANLVDPKDVYDASAYGGIGFYAKKGPGVGKIRLKVPDSNTDPQAGTCKECFNDFGIELELTDQWTKYVVPYTVMKQDVGWGDPLVAKITPSKLYGIQFQVNVPGQPYDIWIDNLTFTGCGAAKPAAQ